MVDLQVKERLEEIKKLSTHIDSESTDRNEDDEEINQYEQLLRDLEMNVRNHIRVLTFNSNFLDRTSTKASQ